FTPFKPGVKIVQPRAGTMDVVGCSKSVVGLARLSVGLTDAVRVGFLGMGVVGAPVEVVVGPVGVVVARSCSDPQPETTITTTSAMAAPLDGRILRPLPSALVIETPARPWAFRLGLEPRLRVRYVDVDHVVAVGLPELLDVEADLGPQAERHAAEAPER